MKITPQIMYVSATPDEWELARSQQIVEQLIRPTGLIDPVISVRKSKGQIPDLIREIESRVTKKERILVTTLTKRTAEDLARYLDKKYTDIKVAYLHSDIDTLTRQDILEDLRKGIYDVLVGINLLREGLDLPEVSLVAILDADKEGFLRSRTSLIQTMGRAARHENGQVIMYADTMTRSMKLAINEVNRRRTTQLEYNKSHNITPATIQKPIRERLIKDLEKNRKLKDWDLLNKSHLNTFEKSTKIDTNSLTPKEKKEYIKILRNIMHEAARNLDFEEAARIRDKIKEFE